MADNTTLNTGSGGDVISTDDLGSVKVQRVKVQYGVDGSATDVSDSNPLPIDDAGGSLTVDGTVELGATSLAALETINAAQSGNWSARVQDGAGNALTSKAPGSERALSVAIVDGAGNQVTSFGGSGGTSATDDAAFTAASGSGTPMMAFATADSVDSGDVGVVAMTTARALHVAVQGTVSVTDGSGSLTVDGTVELGATTLAALESITVVDGGSTISIDDGAGSITVDGTVELGATSLAALESLTTINAVTTVGTITNAVTVVGSAAEDAAASGNPVLIGGRYDSSARTLETGDVGAIALNASGQVLVEIAAGAGSGGTSAADGATFTRNTTSITPVGAVVETSAPTLTNGDVAGLSQDTSGRLRVRVDAGGVAGQVDDAAVTPATTEGVMIMAMADETTPDSVDEGDGGMLRMTLSRALHVNVRDDAGDSCMDGTNNAVRVNIVAGAGSGGTAMTDDAAFTPGSTSVTPIGAMLDNTTPDSVDEGDVGVVRMSANRNLFVSLRDAAGNERGLNVDASGQIAVTVASLPASTNTIEVVGDAAHDAAAAGNPLLQGGYASAAAPTDVSADGDAVRSWHLRNGAQATVITAAGALVGGDATNGLDVDVTRVIPGTTATALGKAEDAAHTSGDTGVMALGVRSDTAAASSGTTGDYEPFHTDSVGAMWTRSTGELADDAAFTPGTSRVMPVGLQADESATDSVDEGDVGCPRMTLDRKQIVTPYAHAAGGATPGRLVSAASTNGTVVKASAGTLYALVVMNLNAAVRYLKVYNSTSVTVGTTTPTWTFPIPASTTGAGFAVPIPACGIAFGTGICLGITTGVADNDTGAVAANEIIANYAYI